jgi:hypothetical protein
MSALVRFNGRHGGNGRHRPSTAFGSRQTAALLSDSAARLTVKYFDENLEHGWRFVETVVSSRKEFW